MSDDVDPAAQHSAENAALRAQVEAVRALQREWFDRSCEATSERASWRRVARELRAALASREGAEG